MNRNCESNKEKYNYGVYWLPLQIQTTDIHTKLMYHTLNYDFNINVSFGIHMLKDFFFFGGGGNFYRKGSSTLYKFVALSTFLLSLSS